MEAPTNSRDESTQVPTKRATSFRVARLILGALLAVLAGIVIVFVLLRPHPPQAQSTSREVPVAESSVAPQPDEATWLNSNFPSIQSSKSNHDENSIMFDYYSYSVAALDSDTWEITSTDKTDDTVKLSRDEASNVISEESVTCRIKFRDIAWETMAPFPMYSENMPKRAIPLPVEDQSYEHCIQWTISGNSQIMSCNITERRGDSTETKPSVPLISLNFQTIDQADSIRMAIIRHANPSAAADLDRESAWIKASIDTAPVLEKDHGVSAVGPYDIQTTKTLKIIPVTKKYWRFIDDETTERREDGKHSTSESETVCGVDVKAVDWSKAQIVLRRDIKTNRPMGPAGVTISDEKHLLCDSFLLQPTRTFFQWATMGPHFDSADAAQQFVSAMAQHTGQKVPTFHVN